jgi:hypothetical protein
VNTKKELDQQVLIKLFEIQEEIKTLRGTLWKKLQMKLKHN